jgi:hypothetical protein
MQQPEGRPLELRRQDAIVEVTVPRLEMHSMVVFDIETWFLADAMRLESQLAGRTIPVVPCLVNELPPSTRDCMTMFFTFRHS